MATEAPFLRDGTNVAAADYSNTAGLGGQGGSAQFFAVALSQVADRTVVLASGAGQQIYGILQNKPKLGDAADVAFLGVTKAQVGTGGTTRGKPQMVTALGTITDWTSTGNKAQIGYALESGVAGVIVSICLVPTGNSVA